MAHQANWKLILLLLILLCQITWSLFSKIVIPAWIASIQAPCMHLSLPYIALNTRFSAGMTSLSIIWQSRIKVYGQPVLAGQLILTAITEISYTRFALLGEFKHTALKSHRAPWFLKNFCQIISACLLPGTFAPCSQVHLHHLRHQYK